MILRSATARVALLTLALWSLSAPLASAQGVDDCSQAVPDVLEAGTPLLWTGDNSTATAIGDALPGNVGRRAVHRFEQRREAALRVQ